MGYYIYKYEDKEVDYIGKTCNLSQRITQHKTDKLAGYSGRIYFFQCPNETAMNSWEYFLINKYHPKYNIQLNNLSIKIDISEPKWTLYLEENRVASLHQKVRKRPQSKKNVTFYCRHCGVKFTTNKWRKTKKGYSAYCPKCPYSVWAA